MEGVTNGFLKAHCLCLTCALLPYLFHLLAPPLQLSCQRKVEISSNSYCFARSAPPPSSFPPFFHYLLSPAAYWPEDLTALFLNLVVLRSFYFEHRKTCPSKTKHNVIFIAVHLCTLSWCTLTQVYVSNTDDLKMYSAKCLLFERQEDQ